MALDNENNRSQGTHARHERAENAPQTATNYPAQNQRASMMGQRSNSTFSYGSSHNEELLQRARKQRRGGRKVFAVVGIVLAVIVVLCGAFGAGLAFSAKDLKSQASSAMSDVSAIQDAISAGDYTLAASSAESLQSSAVKLNEGLSSPLWNIATFLPVVGHDVKGVQTLASVLEDVSTNALVPLTSALETTPPSDLVKDDGSLDVASISSLLGLVQESAPVMERASEDLSGIGTMNISQLQDVVGPATEKFQTINNLFQKVDTLAPVISDMLGANGDRTYLITAQNTDEIRAAGGYPGSVGTLTISNGVISLDDFQIPTDVFDETTPASASITDVEHSLFSYHVDTTRDLGWNPDFERVASVWATSYAEHNGVQVDGVISLTPSIVQDILSVTGPITLSDGTELNGDNATKALEYDMYWKYCSGNKYAEGGNAASDALFAEAAQLTFEKMFSSIDSGSLKKYAKVLSSGIDDRRVMLWLTDESEQDQIASIDCSGAMNTDPSEPQLGVFVNMYNASKQGWYLDMVTTVGDSVENSDGSVSYQVTTTLTNTCTEEEALSGGVYLFGNNLDGGVYGTIFPCVYLYAPAGGQITDVQSSDGLEYSALEYNGLQVFYSPESVSSGTATKLVPEGSITLTYTVTTAPGEQSTLEVKSTPTLTNYR